MKYLALMIIDSIIDMLIQFSHMPGVSIRSMGSQKICIGLDFLFSYPQINIFLYLHTLIIAPFMYPIKYCAIQHILKKQNTFN